MAFLIALLTMFSFTACSSSSENEDEIEETKSGIEGYWICLESVRQNVKNAYNYNPNDYTEILYFGAYWSDGVLWGGGKVVFIYGILLMPILFSAFVFRYTKTKMIMPFIKKQILNIHFILQNFLIGIYIPMLLLIIKLFYQMEI